MSISESLIYSIHRKRNLNHDDLILSKSRVKEHAEVLTPANIVSDMLDMVGNAMQIQDQSLPLDKTFLEPSCGTGNFLVQILERKLKNAHSDEDIFAAVTTIYAIDIQPDNVLESRLRLLEIIEDSYRTITGIAVTEQILRQYADILEKNIVLGDTLYIGANPFEGVIFQGGMLHLDNNCRITPPAFPPCDRLYFYTWHYGDAPVKDYPEFEVPDNANYTKDTLLTKAYTDIEALDRDGLESTVIQPTHVVQPDTIQIEPAPAQLTQPEPVASTPQPKKSGKKAVASSLLASNFDNF